MKNTKRCYICGIEKPKRDFIIGNVSQRKCNSCELKRRKNKALEDIKKVKPGQYARNLTKALRSEQNARPKTPKQLKRIDEEKIYQTARNEVLKEQFDKHGFYFCLTCGFSTTERSQIQTHHLIHRSLEFNLDRLHSKDNLYLCCQECHNILHRNKAFNDHIINERHLKQPYHEDIK